MARQANDVLAAEVAKRPDRFVGVAALPMQDPEIAAQELQRCIKELGFKGALVNGYLAGRRARQPRSTTTCRSTGRSGARSSASTSRSICIRGRPLPGISPLYEGHRWLFGPTWSFAAETSLHALRLIGSGLFDECPRLQIILGHLGEGLPFYLWRIDNRNNWMKAPHKYAARKRVADYFRANFHLTTSGHFSTPALLDAIAEIGADRVMFSVDYPFEDFSDAADWFDKAEISEADRRKIGRTNAMKLFKLRGQLSRRMRRAAATARRATSGCRAPRGSSASARRPARRDRPRRRRASAPRAACRCCRSWCIEVVISGGQPSKNGMRCSA